MFDITKVNWKKVGIFASGVLFGTAGIKALSSKDAKNVYTNCTAAVLRAKDCVMKMATNIQENAEDIYAEAKNINEERAAEMEEFSDADTAAEAAAALNIPKTAVLVASTGVIGKQLPIDKIKSGVTALSKVLGSSREDAKLAAEAIMTTDTKSKEVACTLELDGKQVTVAGMCKGSGMIHPNMCTMLGFITTDINISKELLTEALKEDIKDTFNMISVDGDTSTNDTVLLLSNGLSGNDKITEKNDDYYKFVEALHNVNVFLSKKIAGDGEGATALFEVKIVNGSSKEQAVTLAKSVITSSLTKAAIYGHDANWGRILCALGYSSAKINPDTVDIYFESKAGKLKIVEKGMATDYSEEKATEILSENYVTAICDMKMGEAEATAWGCDLTHEYVSINADYRS